MRTFVIKTCTFVVLLAGIVLLMHILWIARTEKEVVSAYTLRPDQKYLFLGSSQVGCGIHEASEYENRVLWVSDTTLLHSLVRFKELERRSQLGHVKAVVIPFNYIVPQQYSERTLKWGWYQELPVARNHFKDYPFSRVGFVGYVVSNLRWPFLMVAQSGYPKGRPSIASRPEGWRKKFFATVLHEAQNFSYGNGCCAGWEDLLRSHLCQMKEICQRHSIRFVAFPMPVLPEARANVPRNVLEQERVWWTWMKAQGIDMLEVEELGLDQNVFFDSVHLIEKGAERLTHAVFTSLQNVLK